MRDEALAIRREIGLERGNDRRPHAAYTRALNHGFSLTSNICNQSFQFLIFPSFSLLVSSALPAQWRNSQSDRPRLGLFLGRRNRKPTRSDRADHLSAFP